MRRQFSVKIPLDWKRKLIDRRIQHNSSTAIEALKIIKKQGKVVRDMRSSGKIVPLPVKGYRCIEQLGIHCDDDNYQSIAAYAISMGLNKSDFIRQCLDLEFSPKPEPTEQPPQQELPRCENLAPPA